MTYQITAVSQKLSINVIRQLADEIWGTNNYSLFDDAKRDKNGQYLRATVKVYSLTRDHWKTGKEMVVILLNALQHMKGEKVELRILSSGKPKYITSE